MAAGSRGVYVLRHVLTSGIEYFDTYVSDPNLNTIVVREKNGWNVSISKKFCAFSYPDALAQAELKRTSRIIGLQKQIKEREENVKDVVMRQSKISMLKQKINELERLTFTDPLKD